MVPVTKERVNVPKKMFYCRGIPVWVLKRNRAHEDEILYELRYHILVGVPYQLYQSSPDEDLRDFFICMYGGILC